jgi:hypothetical protein
MFIDNDFPGLLGAELYRPDHQFIAKMVCRPVVVHDFNKQAGETIQMDRYGYWNEEASFTIEARERGETQTIGTLDSREIPKDKVIATLREFTGPNASGSQAASQASTFKIPVARIMKAQRALWQYGVPAFHESIGSNTLFRDFRKWEDRCYIQRMLESPNTYNPRQVVDGGTYAQGPEQFSVIEDLLTVVEGLRMRNALQFEDGNYACLCSPRFLKHLRQDKDFREHSRYVGYSPVQIAPGMPSQPVQIPFVNNPNVLAFGGGQINQAGMVGGMPVMPTGVVFEGVRFFETTNMPTQKVQLNYTAIKPTQNAATHPTGSFLRTAHLGIFFGMQAIGVAIGGAGPEVLLNNNDDFGRFVIAVWRTFGDWVLLNKDFVTVARSYGD